MTKTITQDDVLRYIFKETSNEESAAIKKQLLVDENLMEYYKEMKDTIRKVKNLELEPSNEVTEKILNQTGLPKYESIS